MKKTIIPILCLLIITQIAFAAICEDTRQVNANCSMLTPHIVCGTYDYNVLNISGGVAQTGSLVQLNQSIYYFNLTVGEGDYIVKLCDNTTREIRVTDEGEIMIIGMIILAPLILGLMFLIGSSYLGDEHGIFKIFLFLLSFIPFIVSMNFAVIALVKFFEFTALEEAIGSTIYWFGIIFGVFVIYFIIYAFIKMVKSAATQKQEKMEY